MKITYYMHIWGS